MKTREGEVESRREIVGGEEVRRRRTEEEGATGGLGEREDLPVGGRIEEVGEDTTNEEGDALSARLLPSCLSSLNPLVVVEVEADQCQSSPNWQDTRDRVAGIQAKVKEREERATSLELREGGEGEEGEEGAKQRGVWRREEEEGSSEPSSLEPSSLEPSSSSRASISISSASPIAPPIASPLNFELTPALPSSSNLASTVSVEVIKRRRWRRWRRRGVAEESDEEENDSEQARRVES